MPVDSRVPVAALAAALLVGCSAGAPPTPAAAPAPTSAAPDPVTVCTSQLTYWAGEQLRGAPDAGFDYQEMGLTNAQADALAVLVDEARAQGQGRPPDWVPNRARELCTQLAVHPRPTAAGWP
jgi:hypothetical protein